jgi:hypothetical protein
MTFAVLTHHKCASNWLIAYCRAVANLNGLSIRATHRSNEAFADRPDIVVAINALHGFARQQDWSGVHVIRNPLDLVCSAYFSHRNTHRVEGWRMMTLQRDLLRSVSKAEGMMMTIAALERADFDVRVVGPLLAMREWNYGDPHIATLRMEDAVGDVDATIGAAFKAWFGTGLNLPDPAGFAFQAFSKGRRPGEIDEDSHYRSGQADAWREDMPEAAVKYVRLHMRDVLERFYPDGLAPSPDTSGAPYGARGAADLKVFPQPPRRPHEHVGVGIDRFAGHDGLGVGEGLG